MPVPTAGALCAIDIDGVLETSPLGFSSLTPTGAVTLRAVTLHGYRPILATGRSLDEVRERCAAYHLAGGVAEYGAVVYNHGTERFESYYLSVIAMTLIGSARCWVRSLGCLLIVTTAAPYEPIASIRPARGTA